MRKLISSSVEVSISQSFFSELHSNGFRSLRYLRFKQFMNTGVFGVISLRVIPFEQQLVALRIGEKREHRNWFIGIRDYSFEQSLKVTGHPFDRRMIK